MNILICHERFLFRFGADRVLILLGKGLKERGHTVTLMANRYDPEIVSSFAEQIIDTPVGSAYLDLNEFTAEWLRANWNILFALGNIPDVVVVGGWPFISAISFFRKVCPQVIFIDFGVVPTYGYPEGVTTTLEKLRSLRKQHLGDASLVVGISRFIADSQSRPDSGNGPPIRSILLGADHMEMTVWKAARLELADQHGRAISLVRSLREQGKKILLCLGRWEPGCYKNSQAALDVMEDLTFSNLDCVLLVLEEASKVEIPARLKHAILPIGFPDDPELMEVMKDVDIGISLSLWEGFNLPLAEMQWLGKAALAFEVGAHSEVVIHPWYLCSDTRKMSSKAQEYLCGGGPEGAMLAESQERFRDYFRWDRFIEEYSGILKGADSGSGGLKRRLPSALVVDVTSSTRDPSNPGVIRVTRRLSRELQLYGEDPIFVVWEQGTERYVLPTQDECMTLGRFNGPVVSEAERISESPHRRTALDGILDGEESPRPWLLFPEVMMETSFRGAREFARRRNFKTAAVFYDSIPVLRPDLCNEEIRSNHRQYMLGLAECDLVLPISHFSSDCLRDFWREPGIGTSCQVVPDVLPGEFGGTQRVSLPPERGVGRTNILCVSTLEPRKNHRNLIEACLQLTERHPEFDWSLTLVGGRYYGSFEIAEWVEEMAAKNSRIKWLGVVDDKALEHCYQEASFTVYPSVIEGFGLPIVESIWHGRPCICYSEGVMAELAEGGGCFTTDVTDPIRLSEAIYRLGTDGDLRLKLSREATTRPLRTWHDYAADLIGAIKRLTPPSRAWQGAVYPNCLCENWQMNDSERMALTGLLARHRPHCSIEVGTYHGGSLSLISQYSELIFSIDIDDSIPSRLAFPNVSFLSGRSTVILPLLLQELDKAGTPVDFVLVDGDHSAAGVRADVSCLLDYIPKKPFFVVLHDSFNPECRRGMLEAVWERSPYCHWVDIDFVPGRMTETPGRFQGELWGGLAAAYFLPVPRRGELRISRTAEGMFQVLSSARAGQESARA